MTIQQILSTQVLNSPIEAIEVCSLSSSIKSWLATPFQADPDNYFDILEKKAIIDANGKDNCIPVLPAFDINDDSFNIYLLSNRLLMQVSDIDIINKGGIIDIPIVNQLHTSYHINTLATTSIINLAMLHQHIFGNTFIDNGHSINATPIQIDLLSMLIYCAEVDYACKNQGRIRNAGIGMTFTNSLVPDFYIMCEYAL